MLTPVNPEPEPLKLEAVTIPDASTVPTVIFGVPARLNAVVAKETELIPVRFDPSP